MMIIGTITLSTLVIGVGQNSPVLQLPFELLILATVQNCDKLIIISIH